MKKAAYKNTSSQSGFLTTLIAPSRHTQTEARFSPVEAVLAIALIFGTLAVMRCILIGLTVGPFR